MVEIAIHDETGEVTLILSWKKRSTKVCYRFADVRVAKASFRLLGRIEGVDEDTWEKMGI